MLVARTSWPVNSFFVFMIYTRTMYVYTYISIYIHIYISLYLYDFYKDV